MQYLLFGDKGLVFRVLTTSTRKPVKYTRNWKPATEVRANDVKLTVSYLLKLFNILRSYAQHLYREDQMLQVLECKSHTSCQGSCRKDFQGLCSWQSHRGTFQMLGVFRMYYSNLLPCWVGLECWWHILRRNSVLYLNIAHLNLKKNGLEIIPIRFPTNQSVSLSLISPSEKHRMFISYPYLHWFVCKHELNGNEKYWH